MYEGKALYVLLMHRESACLLVTVLLLNFLTALKLQGTDTIFLGFQPGIDISLVIIQQQELPTFKQATRHVDASRNTQEQVSWR